MGKKNNKRTHVKGVQKKTTVSKNAVPWFFYIFFGLLFSLLPLVYYRNGLDPAIHPRLLFLGIILIPSLVYLFWIRKKPFLNSSVLFQAIFYFLAGYTAITAVSMIFAVNPGESMYDINKSFSILIFIGFSSILFFNTKNWQNSLPLFFIIPALVLISIGIGEYYEHVLFAISEHNAESLPWIYQVRGNMAHKNQYSIALMLMLPFLIFGIVKRKGFFKFLFAFLFIIILIILIVLKTRSVWVGMATSTFVAVIILVFFGNHFKLKKNIRMAVGLTLLLASLALASVVYFSETTNKESIVFKLKNITNPADGNNIHRIKIWELTGQMIKDRPLHGVGAGNWKIESRYYFAGYNFSKVQLNWLRPHNDYLWVFSEKGVFGILLFLGIFVTAFVYFRKIIISDLETEKKILALLLTSGIISYLTVSFFTFPLERMNHQIYIALMLAALTALYHQKFGKTQKSAAVKILAVFSILLLGFSVFYAITVLDMERKVKQARILHQTNKWEELNKLSKEIPKTFKTLDAEAMPLDWYAGLSFANLNKIEEANQAYLKAFHQNPTKESVLNNLGRTYFQMGDYENAKVYFEKALVILPDYFEALVNLSSTYIQIDDYENAYATLNKIQRNQLNDPLKKNLRFVQRKLREQGKLPEN